MTAALRIGASVLIAGVILAWALGIFDPLLNRFHAEAVKAIVAGVGPWGPILIIALMCLAVVASPIPSAPIANAAGAAYGHYAGALYVAAGSVLGATLAFLIARRLGREAVRRLLGKAIEQGLWGSQNALMLIVLTSRLMPFVSFDAISYAAGLSKLTAWRFVVATIAGITPASFILAHLGSEAVRGDAGTALWIAGGLGLLTGGSLLVLTLRHGPKERTPAKPPPPAREEAST